MISFQNSELESKNLTFLNNSQRHIVGLYCSRVNTAVHVHMFSKDRLIYITDTFFFHNTKGYISCELEFRVKIFAINRVLFLHSSIKNVFHI